jgi:cysteine desulfurase
MGAEPTPIEVDQAALGEPVALVESATQAPVYLDYAATSPVDPRVAAVMARHLTADGDFGNPSSATHAYGRAAAQAIELARAQVAALIGATDPASIVFTSGATEANNLAILGRARGSADRGRHIVTMRTEHKAVIDPCRQLEREGFTVTWLEPGSDGLLDPAALRAALRPDTLLVSIMHVNNETGVIQDLAALSAVCRERPDVLLHTDAAQSAGRLPLDVAALGVDLLSLSAHKLCGPKGVGALYVSPRARPWIAPQLLGGGQERGLRAGTLPTHQVAGFGAAARFAHDEGASDASRCRALRLRLEALLGALPGVSINAEASPRSPGILSACFSGVDGESLMAALPQLALSAGAACDSANGEPSYVLRALGLSPELADSTLRISLGRFTTALEIETAAATIAGAVDRLQALAPPAFPEPPAAGWVQGRAGSRREHAQVVFEVRPAADGTVSEARVRAYGCPHTLAVACALAQRLPGRRLAALAPGTPLEWAGEFAVPVERLGRLLIIEDALQAIAGRAITE